MPSTTPLRRDTPPPGAHRAPPARIRLLIVDDSLVARTVLSRMLADRPEFEVVACAADVDEALAMLGRLRVDIVLLDVEMPGTDGLTALPALLARCGDARILIVSSAAASGAQATVQALMLGAADTLLKPGAGYFAGRFAEELAERLLRLAPDAAASPAVRALDDWMPHSLPAAPIECLAIGASTGGVDALAAFFRALSPDFRAPILVTQHLPAVFMPYFAAQIRETAGRPTRIGVDGMCPRPGEIVIAPGDGHLCLMRNRGALHVRIDRTPAASGCLPSVDPMFAALAQACGAAGHGVVLSGMGRDGVLGAAAIVRAGGAVLVQDARSSVVWGMPGAVANAGLASSILDPAGLAGRLGQGGEAPRWK